MQKNFEAIDIFFIVIISLYFVVLFIFITIFLIKYFDIDKKKKNEVIDLPEDKLKIDKKKPAKNSPKKKNNSKVKSKLKTKKKQKKKK